MIALLLALILPVRAEVVDRLAAVVNDEVVTLSEVYELGGDYISARVQASPGHPQTRREAELEVLDSLIDRKLIAQEIQRLALDVTEEELDRTIDDLARRNGLDRERLREEVEGSGMPWTQYRSELRENLRQRKFTQTVILPRISVNEDELQDAYRRMVLAAGLPQVADLGAILLPYPEGADEAAKAAVLARGEAIAARIRAGEDFAAVAAVEDGGPYGAQGGRMGSFRRGELIEALDRAAFSQAPGTIGDPIPMASGVFLLYVFDRRADAAQPYEAARSELFDQVYADRIEDETEQWTQQARRKAAVSVKLEGPAGH